MPTVTSPARAASLLSTGTASSRLPSRMSVFCAMSGSLARIFSLLASKKWIIREGGNGISRSGSGAPTASGLKKSRGCAHEAPCGNRSGVAARGRRDVAAARVRYRARPRRRSASRTSSSRRATRRVSGRDASAALGRAARTDGTRARRATPVVEHESAGVRSAPSRRHVRPVSRIDARAAAPCDRCRDESLTIGARASRQRGARAARSLGAAARGLQRDGIVEDRAGGAECRAAAGSRSRHVRAPRGRAPAHLRLPDGASRTPWGTQPARSTSVRATVVHGRPSM